MGKATDMFGSTQSCGSRDSRTGRLSGGDSSRLGSDNLKSKSPFSLAIQQTHGNSTNTRRDNKFLTAICLRASGSLATDTFESY